MTSVDNHVDSVELRVFYHNKKKKVTLMTTYQDIV